MLLFCEFFLGMLLLKFCNVQSGNSRSFVTENCGHVLGPDYGAYMEFDRSASRKGDKVGIPQSLKGSLIECLIVVRGMPAIGGEKRYMAMHWKSFFIQDPAVNTIQSSPEDCKKAYVSVYRGMDRTSPLIGTYCGKDTLQRNIETEGEYITLFFYVDYRNPNLPSPSPVTTVPTPEDNFPYPLVHFRLDMTSYDYECEDTVPGVVMKCNDSQRCLDDSLRCDFWYSRNCISPKFPRDKSDAGRFSPALCWVKATTTTMAPTTEAPVLEPFDWTPVAAAIGGVAAFILLLWCCCLPGYLPWRCARLRNSRCVHKCASQLPSGCKQCHGPCCAGDYGSSPTGSAAMMKMRQQRLIDSYSNGYPNGSQYSGEEDFPKKTFKAKIINCLSEKNSSGWPVLRHGSVAPIERIDGPKIKDRVAPFPYDKIQRPGDIPNRPANLPNGTSPFDLRNDPEGLSTGWIKLVLSDGGHLREQR